jgi:hypothetical protein
MVVEESAIGDENPARKAVNQGDADRPENLRAIVWRDYLGAVDISRKRIFN